jgi:hypothetical protein
VGEKDGYPPNGTGGQKNRASGSRVSRQEVDGGNGKSLSAAGIARKVGAGGTALAVARETPEAAAGMAEGGWRWSRQSIQPKRRPQALA